MLHRTDVVERIVGVPEKEKLRQFFVDRVLEHQEQGNIPLVKASPMTVTSGIENAGGSAGPHRR